VVHTATVAHQPSNRADMRQSLFKLKNACSDSSVPYPRVRPGPSPSIVSQHSSFGPYNHVNINARNDRNHAQSTQ
jgi:hypothetical protein